jgi:hypothetical protein
MASQLSSQTTDNSQVPSRRPPTIWAKRGAIAAFCLSLVPVVAIGWSWWVRPVTGDDIMGAGYSFLVLATPASLILPGDFTSRGRLAEIVALVILSIQWVIVGALIGWLLGLLINALRSSQHEAI